MDASTIHGGKTEVKILLFQLSVTVRESDIKLLNCMIKQPDCGIMTMVFKIFIVVDKHNRCAFVGGLVDIS